LRLAPELRRSAAYWASTSFLLIGLTVALYFAVGVPGVRGPLYLCFLGPLCVSPVFFGPAVPVWRYALRVDNRGIWRRRLFGWDLWTWDAFANGTVREGVAPYGWLNPDKPWHRRKLSFAALAEADRDWLMERVRQVWTPPPVRLPEEIKIRKHGMPWLHLDLSPRGIVLWEEKGDHARHYGWADVLQVRVTRFDHGRHDFTRVELELPAGEPTEVLRKRPGLEGCNWDGPDPEVVLAFLQEYVDGGRVQVTALTGTPRTADEADRSLRDLEQTHHRDRAKGQFLTVLILFCGVLWLFQGPGALHWNGYQWFASGLAYFVGGLFLLLIRMGMAEGRRRYEQRRAEIASRTAQATSAATGRDG
jgi:hypothetical protein